MTAAVAVGQDAPRTIRVIIVDSQAQPLPDAKVHISVWTDDKNYPAKRDWLTDATGVATIELPKSLNILRVWVSKKTYVTLYFGWESEELAGGKWPPAEYMIRMEAGVSAGGRVIDEWGKPIAGARVEVRIDGRGTRPAGADTRVLHSGGLASGADAAVTDADGRWRIGNVPADAAIPLKVRLNHEDHISDDLWGHTQTASGVTSDRLRNETATLVMKRGVVVRGRVTDPSGAPVKDAIVCFSRDPYAAGRPTEFLTDADGRYRLPALPPRETPLTVIAPGWAPQWRKVNLQADAAVQDFNLEPGQTMRLRITDSEGRPARGASVRLLGWKGGQALHNYRHPDVRNTQIPVGANSDGIWEWAWAPATEPIKLKVGAPGFAAADMEIAGGGSEQTVALRPEHRLTGRVVDAETGQPVKDFVVIPLNVFRKDWLSAERGNAVAGRAGRLDFLATRTDIPVRLRIEAAGYRNQDGPEFRVGDDTARTQDFRMVRSAPVAGVVLGVDDMPAAGVSVMLATPTQTADLHENYGNQLSTTDAAGRFTFPDPGERWTIVARSDAGFARVEQGKADRVQLQPWASITGRFSDGGKPVKGARVFFSTNTITGPGHLQFFTQTYTATDTDGRFTFSQVPPGQVCVWLDISPWQDAGFRSGPSVPLDLRPSQRVELDLGAAGATVTGQVKLTGKRPADLDCSYSLNHLISRTTRVAPPAGLDVATLNADELWTTAFLKSQEGQAYRRTFQSWFVKLAPDGSFRVSGVPPGEYDLVVEVYAKPSGCLVDPLARATVRVTVPSGRDTLALPDVLVEVVPIPAVGDMPALTYRRPDGTGGSAADFRGRLTVVHFWASWCAPCKEQFPALRRVHDEFAKLNVATVGLSLDDKPAAWSAALQRQALPWPQGLLTDGVKTVGSVPAYWVLDPAGKLVAKAFDPDELRVALAMQFK